MLYHLISRKLHPYPSLSELRDHRKAIDQSQTFGSILLTRLATSPTLGVRDVWEMFDDYRHVRKMKKAKKNKDALDAGHLPSPDGNASVPSVSFSTPDFAAEAEAEEAKVHEAHLKRLGLFAMNEIADLLERIKK